MTPKSFLLDDALHRYLVEHGSPPDPVASDLIEVTRSLGGISSMQIAPEQGAFLTFLARVTGARRAVEVGTFTGYSALCIARGLADGGRLLCCDVSREWTDIGRPFWERAGVADRIELRLGPAIDTLRSLAPDEVLDLAFIDADKGSYPEYYEEILTRLRPGGVVAVDNVLWGGRVVDREAVATADEHGAAILAFNDLVAADDRVEAVMLPLADGVTLARKL